MKNLKMIGVVFCVIAFCVTISYGADVAKIGIVDFQKIFVDSNAGKDADVKFKKKGNALKAKLMKKAKGIEELKSKYERESLVMSKEKRDEKARELRIEINDYKLMENKSKEELKKVNGKLAIEIRDDVLKVIEKIGKSGGFLVILDKPAVLYSPNSIDITDKVIKDYNKMDAKKK